MRRQRRSRGSLVLASLSFACGTAWVSQAAAQSEQLVPPPGNRWSIPTANPVGLEPRATEMLKRMADYLHGLHAFSFTADSTTDIVADTGQKIQYLGLTEVVVRRPDRVWSRRIGPVAQADLFFDGKRVTLHIKGANYYATQAAPPTLDGVLDLLQDRLGVTLPAAELCYSNAYEELMAGTTSGFYVGLGEVGGVKAHQLAFRGTDFDWQIWVEDGARPVPLKYVITNRWYAGAPEANVVLTNWNFEPKATDDMFIFKPPAGATKTEFLTPAGVPGLSH